ncbi:MAG: hypothetical protein BA861_04985 [Desulfobacterales bacterium S3730MH5]|nr:MAG: hypothetical protein BA861_04985 [Desulfobacterales bacterium S3730MH5]
MLDHCQGFRLASLCAGITKDAFEPIYLPLVFLSVDKNCTGRASLGAKRTDSTFRRVNLNATACSFVENWFPERVHLAGRFAEHAPGYGF